MFNVDYNPPEKIEKRRLLVMSLALTTAAAGLWFLVGTAWFAGVFLLLSLAALLGFVFYRYVGRDVYLVITVLFHMIGRVVSWIVLLAIFAFGIILPGLVLRLFGMDRLEKDFRRCRKKASMFVDPAPYDLESFRRQS